MNNNVGQDNSNPNSNSANNGGTARNNANIPLLTVRSGMNRSNKRSLRCELEQMEHAFLDLDDLGIVEGEDFVEYDLLDEEEDLVEGDEWIFRGKRHPESVLQSLNDLRKREIFCDVSIKVGERIFPAHKCVLAAVSNYFRAMFTSSLCVESRQDEVKINGISPSIMELLFDYAYTAEVRITSNNVQHLLAAANLLDILPVRDACCRYLDRHMDENNSLGIANFAEMHACQELQTKAKKFALKKFSEIVEGDEF